MFSIDSLRKIALSMKPDSLNNRILNTFIVFFYSLVLLSVGANIYAAFLENSNLHILSKLSIIVGLAALIYISSLILIEKILSIRIIKNSFLLSKTEIKELGKEITREIIPILEKELKLPDSIFSERTNHYRNEKLFIAKKTAELIEKRIKYLQKIQPFKKIRVIFDAGTTIAPILDELVGSIAGSNEPWAKDVEFVTNNIHAMHLILKYRNTHGLEAERQNRQAIRHQNIPVTCSVLPGQIEAAYQAIADENTLLALKYIKSLASKSYNICISTGNYLLLDGQKEVIFPVARTRFHPHVKSGLFWIADEMYLVAPLGKTLTTQKKDKSIDDLLERFNMSLGYKNVPDDPEKEAYRITDLKLLDEINGFRNRSKVKDRNELMRKTILITTSRAEHTCLYPHSFFIRRSLKEFDGTEFPLSGPYGFLNTFHDLPNNREDQLEIEFPHINLRAMWENYFEHE